LRTIKTVPKKWADHSHGRLIKSMIEGMAFQEEKRDDSRLSRFDNLRHGSARGTDRSHERMVKLLKTIKTVPKKWANRAHGAVGSAVEFMNAVSLPWRLPGGRAPRGKPAGHAGLLISLWHKRWRARRPERVEEA